MRRRAYSAILTLLVTALAAGCTPTYQDYLPRHLMPVLARDAAIMKDGARLPLAYYPAAGIDGPWAVVVALHGFNDYRRAFEGLGPALARRGIAVYAFDQRSFGETARRGIWPAPGLLTEDVGTILRLVAAAHPGVPLYAVGESMGGAVLLAAQGDGRLPEAVDGLVLLAPAVWGRAALPAWQESALELFVRAVPWLPVSGADLGLRASDNDAALRALGRDPLVIKETRVDAIYGLVGMMDRALASGPQLTRPALILYGLRDEIVPRRPVCSLLLSLPAAPAGRWRFLLYREGFHLLLRDRGAATVHADIAAWMADPEAALPSAAIEISAADPPARRAGSPLCDAAALAAARDSDP